MHVYDEIDEGFPDGWCGGVVVWYSVEDSRWVTDIVWMENRTRRWERNLPSAPFC